LVLRDLEGLSTAEVAQALGCTAVTVRVLLHQARHRARSLIEEDP
jgi:DNA-directed RNA polymerase specialized sigma24 family protein